MKTEAILVRHGETEANRLNAFRGRLDVPLNENGREQAEALARAMEQKQIKAIYSSPLSRALDTAKTIGKTKGLTVNIIEGFNNINLGEWEGRPKDEVKEKYPDFWHQWVNDTEHMKFPGGDTLEDAKNRAFKALKEVMEENKGETIVVVSHRCIIKVLIAAVLDMNDRYFWKFYLDNASYSTVEYDDNKGFILTCLNEACHIGKKVYEEF